jgi:predicted NACHT family NTPase
MLEIVAAAAGGVAIKHAWDKLSESLLSKMGSEAKQKWKEFVEWPTAQAAYNSRVIANNSKTILLGNPHPVVIEDVYVDLIASTYSEGSHSEYEIGDDLNSNKDLDQLNQHRVGAADLLSIHHRIYITGKPGAGKTTFLRYLALQAAKGKINRIPVLLVLRNWSENQSLEKQICDEFDICNFPEPKDFVACILREGRAILLLDGLDEIKTGNNVRRKAINEIIRFAKKYPGVPIVLSCRKAAEDYSFEQFDYAELADFTKDQQRKFIATWFAFDDKRLRGFLAEWEKPESKGHRDLAGTPLLLALLCLAFNTHYKFAPNRTQLYEDATSALFSTWDASRNVQRDCLYEDLTHQRKKQIHLFDGLSSLEIWTHRI